MAIPSSFYGTVAEGDTYFANRLTGNRPGWTTRSDTDKTNALRRMTQIIDTLSFKGNKHTVYELLEADPTASSEEVRAAEAAQELEFPRGEDTTVPEAIAIATYEGADALLRGVDPELEYENLMTTELRFADVRTKYDRSIAPVEHILAGVPSVIAWRYLRPFLRDGLALRMIRV